LFTEGRVFISVDALHDALNTYGLGYFGVVSQGKSFECHMGPDHKKGKKATSSLCINDELDLALAEEENSFLPPAKKHRGRGKSSLKIGCKYCINYQPINDPNDPTKKNIVIKSTNHYHDKCLPEDEITYQSIMKKSHASFFGISDEVKKFIVYLIATSDAGMDTSFIRKIAEKSLPEGLYFIAYMYQRYISISLSLCFCLTLSLSL